MLGIQLTALSVAELRRLLEVARARGQEGLARELEAELAARPGRTIGGQPAPMSAARQPPLLRPPPPPVVRRRPGPAVAVAGLAAFIGATIAWGLTLETPAPPKPKPQPVALVASSPAPRVAVALSTTALPEEAPNQPYEEPAAPALEAVAGPPAVRAAPHDNPCLDLPTAHQRLVCGYPSLAILDRRMKATLERARSASGDPDALDSAQAVWQAASTNIQDRQTLAERYARRIAELEAE